MAIYDSSLKDRDWSTYNGGNSSNNKTNNNSNKTNNNSNKTNNNSNKTNNNSNKTNNNSNKTNNNSNKTNNNSNKTNNNSNKTNNNSNKNIYDSSLKDRDWSTYNGGNSSSSSSKSPNKTSNNSNKNIYDSSSKDRDFSNLNGASLIKVYDSSLREKNWSALNGGAAYRNNISDNLKVNALLLSGASDKMKNSSNDLYDAITIIDKINNVSSNNIINKEEQNLMVQLGALQALLIDSNAKEKDIDKIINNIVNKYEDVNKNVQNGGYVLNELGKPIINQDKWQDEIYNYAEKQVNNYLSGLRNKEIINKVIETKDINYAGEVIKDTISTGGYIFGKGIAKIFETTSDALETAYLFVRDHEIVENEKMAKLGKTDNSNLVNEVLFSETKFTDYKMEKLGKTDWNDWSIEENIENIKKDMTSNWYDELLNTKNVEVNGFTKKENFTDNSLITETGIGGQIIQNFGEMIPNIIIGNVAGSAASMAALFTKSFGSSAEYAFSSGANIEDATTYAALSAGVEVLSEKIAAPKGGVLPEGSGVLDDLLQYSNPYEKLIVDALGEVGEEQLVNLLQPFIKIGTIEKNSDLKTLFQQDFVDQIEDTTVVTLGTTMLCNLLGFSIDGINSMTTQKNIENSFNNLSKEQQNTILKMVEYSKDNNIRDNADINTNANHNLGANIKINYNRDIMNKHAKIKAQKENISKKEAKKIYYEQANAIVNTAIQKIINSPLLKKFSQEELLKAIKQMEFVVVETQEELIQLHSQKLNSVMGFCRGNQIFVCQECAKEAIIHEIIHGLDNYFNMDLKFYFNNWWYSGLNEAITEYINLKIDNNISIYSSSYHIGLPYVEYLIQALENMNIDIMSVKYSGKSNSKGLSPNSILEEVFNMVSGGKVTFNYLIFNQHFENYMFGKHPNLGSREQSRLIVEEMIMKIYEYSKTYYVDLSHYNKKPQSKNNKRSIRNIFFKGNNSNNISYTLADSDNTVSNLNNYQQDKTKNNEEINSERKVHNNPKPQSEIDKKIVAALSKAFDISEEDAIENFFRKSEQIVDEAIEQVVNSEYLLNFFDKQEIQSALDKVKFIVFENNEQFKLFNEQYYKLLNRKASSRTKAFCLGDVIAISKEDANWSIIHEINHALDNYFNIDLSSIHFTNSRIIDKSTNEEISSDIDFESFDGFNEVVTEYSHLKQNNKLKESGAFYKIGLEYIELLEKALKNMKTSIMAIKYNGEKIPIFGKINKEEITIDNENGLTSAISHSVDSYKGNNILKEVFNLINPDGGELYVHFLNLFQNLIYNEDSNVRQSAANEIQNIIGQIYDYTKTHTVDLSIYNTKKSIKSFSINADDTLNNNPTIQETISYNENDSSQSDINNIKVVHQNPEPQTERDQKVVTALSNVFNISEEEVIENYFRKSNETINEAITKMANSKSLLEVLTKEEIIEATNFMQVIVLKNVEEVQKIYEELERLNNKIVSDSVMGFCCGDLIVVSEGDFATIVHEANHFLDNFYDMGISSNSFVITSTFKNDSSFEMLKSEKKGNISYIGFNEAVTEYNAMRQLNKDISESVAGYKIGLPFIEFLDAILKEIHTSIMQIKYMGTEQAVYRDTKHSKNTILLNGKEQPIVTYVDVIGKGNNILNELFQLVYGQGTSAYLDFMVLFDNLIYGNIANIGTQEQSAQHLMDCLAKIYEYVKTNNVDFSVYNKKTPNNNIANNNNNNAKPRISERKAVNYEAINNLEIANVLNTLNKTNGQLLLYEKDNNKYLAFNDAVMDYYASEVFESVNLKGQVLQVKKLFDALSSQGYNINEIMASNPQELQQIIDKMAGVGAYEAMVKSYEDPTGTYNFNGDMKRGTRILFDVASKIVKYGGTTATESRIKTIENLSNKLKQMAANKGMDLKELGSQVHDVVTKEEINASELIADEMLKQATIIEPKISADMISLIGINSKLEGFEHRLKSQESLSRKLRLITREKGVDLEMARQSVIDCLRYTLVINDDNYVEGIKKGLDNLQEKGYNVSRFRNTWGDYRYQGVNVVLTSEEGMMIELQFHTPDSFLAKDDLTHLYYEILRNEYTTEYEKKISETVMGIYEAMVNVPTGIIGYNYEVNN